MEYTQEQIDAMIAEAKKGLYTESDLNKKITAEVDRRVESGIKNGVETQRAKWEADYKNSQNLTVEQIAEQKLKEAEQKLKDREREINRRANTAEVKELLSEAGIPKSQYETLIGMLVHDDPEIAKSNAQNFINTFGSLKNEIETKVKSTISQVPPPTQVAKTQVVGRKEFDNMGYAEKLEFKKSNPELYKEFMK